LKLKTYIAIVTFLAVALFATTALAFSVTFVSRYLPSSGVVGYSSTFKAEIEYDSTVYGIPVPADGYFHVEIPRLYGLPTVTAGSWGSWDFTAKTGDMTGKAVWQGRKMFLVFGRITREAEFRAVAQTRGTSQSYIGTGPAPIRADYFRTVIVN